MLYFSRYLYSKAKSSNSTFDNLVLGQNELNFLNENNIDFYPNHNSNTYLVNCAQLKQLFCH